MVHMTVIFSHISGKWHIRLQVTAVVCCKLSFKAVVIRHSRCDGPTALHGSLQRNSVVIWVSCTGTGGKGKQRGRNGRSRDGDGKGNGREKIMN